MKGGKFNFKSNGFFAGKEPIPQDVKIGIDTCTNDGKLYSRNFDAIKGRYRKVINTTDPETKTIYETPHSNIVLKLHKDIFGIFISIFAVEKNKFLN